jgi:hypothetical protein
MKIFILLQFVLLSIVNANILTYNVSANYVMGDNDTKIDARKIALEQAKKIALEQAGTYIEVKTVVKNGKLTTDEIKSFGASVLKVKILNEKYSFKGSSPVLDLTIQASIDMNLLKQNIEKIKNNSTKIKKIISLQKENEKLLKKINLLSKEYNNPKNNTEQIRNQRNELLTKIEKNQNKLKKTFKKGSLFDLSNQFIKKTKLIEQNIENNYFTMIKENLDIKIGNIKVENNNDDTSNVSINISWHLNNYQEILNLIPTIIQAESESESKKDYMGRIYKVKHPRYFIFSYYESKKDLSNIDKKKILNKLTSKQVAIQIHLGKNVKYLPVSTGLDQYTNGKFGHDKLILAINTYGALYSDTTIIFFNIPNELLKSLENIDVDIVIDKPFFRLQGKYERIKDWDYSLFAKDYYRKFELKEFEWRISQIEVSSITSTKKLKKEEALKKLFIKKLDNQKNIWIGLKFKKMDETYSNTKKNRSKLYKEIKQIQRSYINSLDETIKKVHNRTKEENLVFMISNQSSIYTKKYKIK